eukprot:COSAG01_NODE_17248_length_1166_cov_42.598875_2_plen_83_part_00
MLHAPEILSVIDEIPTLRAFMTSLYECDYATFFRSFPSIVSRGSHCITAPSIELALPAQMYVCMYVRMHARWCAGGRAGRLM